MKKSLYVILPLIFVGIIYLSTAFIIWETNPKFWTVNQRLGISVFSIIVIVIGIGLSYEINKKTK